MAARIVRSFSFSTGLTINMEISSLIKINTTVSEVADLADFLNCKVSWALSYLGIPIGEGGGSILTWEPVVERMKNRMTSWKGRLLSQDGRLRLIKSVLSEFPPYYLSILKSPAIVVNKLN